MLGHATRKSKLVSLNVLIYSQVLVAAQQQFMFYCSFYVIFNTEIMLVFICCDVILVDYCSAVYFLIKMNLEIDFIVLPLFFFEFKFIQDRFQWIRTSFTMSYNCFTSPSISRAYTFLIFQITECFKINLFNLFYEVRSHQITQSINNK